jgi:hypothetical protein
VAGLEGNAVMRRVLIRLGAWAGPLLIITISASCGFALGVVFTADPYP